MDIRNQSSKIIYQNSGLNRLSPSGFAWVVRFVVIVALFSASFGWAQSHGKESEAAATKEAPSKDCPDVYCADTSRALRPGPPYAPPPADHIFRDPDFGSRIVRVTDEAGIGGVFPGFSFTTNSSAESNEWGKFNPALGPNGGYYFYIKTGGGGTVLFSMDASTMQVAPYCKWLPRCRSEEHTSELQ